METSVEHSQEGPSENPHIDDPMEDPRRTPACGEIQGGSPSNSPYPEYPLPPRGGPPWRTSRRIPGEPFLPLEWDPVRLSSTELLVNSSAWLPPFCTSFLTPSLWASWNQFPMAHADSKPVLITSSLGLQQNKFKAGPISGILGWGRSKVENYKGEGLSTAKCSNMGNFHKHNAEERNQAQKENTISKWDKGNSRPRIDVITSSE